MAASEEVCVVSDDRVSDPFACERAKLDRNITEMHMQRTTNPNLSQLVTEA